MAAQFLPGQFGDTYNPAPTEVLNQTTDTLSNLAKLKLLQGEAQDNHQQAQANLLGTLLKNKMGQSQYDEWQGQADNRAADATTATQQGQANLAGTLLGNANKSTQNQLGDINLADAAKKLADKWGPEGARTIDQQFRQQVAANQVQQQAANIQKAQAEAQSMNAMAGYHNMLANPTSPQNRLAATQADAATGEKWHKFLVDNDQYGNAMQTPEGKAHLMALGAKMGIPQDALDHAATLYESGLTQQRQETERQRIAEIEDKKHTDTLAPSLAGLEEGINSGNGPQAAGSARVLAHAQLGKGGGYVDPADADALAQNILASRGVRVVDVHPGGGTALIDTTTGQFIPRKQKTPGPTTRPSAAPVQPQQQTQPQQPPSPLPGATGAQAPSPVAGGGAAAQPAAAATLKPMPPGAKAAYYKSAAASLPPGTPKEQVIAAAQRLAQQDGFDPR